MTACHSIRELIPWYITGSLEMVEAERVAAHLRSCSACRDDFVEAAFARCQFEQLLGSTQVPMQAVWEQLSDKIGSSSDEVRLDVGSLMLGLRLGIASASQRQPVHGELRLMGKRYNVFGNRRKEHDVRSKAA